MRGLARSELPRQHYRNECQKTEVRGLEVRERKAFRVRLLADELFVFTSLVPKWSSPTSGVAAATHLSVSSNSNKCFLLSPYPKSVNSRDPRVTQCNYRIGNKIQIWRVLG